jgi:hypothetical protein
MLTCKSFTNVAAGASPSSLTPPPPLRAPVPAIPTLDKWSYRTAVSPWNFSSPQTSPSVALSTGTWLPLLCSSSSSGQGPIWNDLKSSKGLPARLQSPPPNSKAVNFKNVWKIVENSEKCQTNWFESLC